MMVRLFGGYRLERVNIFSCVFSGSRVQPVQSKLINLEWRLSVILLALVSHYTSVDGCLLLRLEKYRDKSISDYVTNYLNSRYCNLVRSKVRFSKNCQLSSPAPYYSPEFKGMVPIFSTPRIRSYVPPL